MFSYGGKDFIYKKQIRNLRYISLIFMHFFNIPMNSGVGASVKKSGDGGSGKWNPFSKPSSDSSIDFSKFVAISR